MGYRCEGPDIRSEAGRAVPFNSAGAIPQNGQTRALARRASRIGCRNRSSAKPKSDTRAPTGTWVACRRDFPRDEIERIGRVPAAAEITKSIGLKRCAIPGQVDWNSRQTESAYRLALLRGISVRTFPPPCIRDQLSARSSVRIGNRTAPTHGPASAALIIDVARSQRLVTRYTGLSRTS